MFIVYTRILLSFQLFSTMAKRMAGRQLNHENWDNVDESEEAGQFKQVES